MKQFFKIAFLTVSLGAAICATVMASPPGQDPRLRIDSLSHLTETASEYVELNLEGPALRTTLSLLYMERSGVGTSIRNLLLEQDAIYIRNFQFDKAGEYSKSDLGEIHRQLTGKGWSRINRRMANLGCADLELYAYQETGSTRGLAVICAEPSELTVINLVGHIKLESLEQLTAVIYRSKSKR